MKGKKQSRSAAPKKVALKRPVAGTTATKVAVKKSVAPKPEGRVASVKVNKSKETVAPSRAVEQALARSKRGTTTPSMTARNEEEAELQIAHPPHTAPEESETNVQPEAPPHKKGMSFLRQGRPKPNELHRGQTVEKGSTHDRPGSQLERERHTYPNGNVPNAGSARSAQYKGKRRDSGPTDK